MKFMKGEENRRKDLLNDEFNFSYKLYKTHFDKIQKNKPTYNKFNVRQLLFRIWTGTITSPKTTMDHHYSRVSCSCCCQLEAC